QIVGELKNPVAFVATGFPSNINLQRKSSVQLLPITATRICCKEAVGLWCQLTIAFNEFNVM
ncbi:hypothetical protein, partial [Fibrobacter sp.]|uniref:hypothetical protein n=1 Tax=Fibrobacter sp. TaxID=35828 RepID=UPI0038640E2E